MGTSDTQGEHAKRTVAWQVPAVILPDEAFVADERAMLEGVLDRYRSALLDRCAGLTAEQLALQAVPPSNLSLLGLIRHVTDVERTWFRRRFLGQDLPPVYFRPDRPDAAFEKLDPALAAAAGTNGTIDILGGSYHGSDSPVRQVDVFAISKPGAGH